MFDQVEQWTESIAPSGCRLSPHDTIFHKQIGLIEFIIMFKRCSKICHPFLRTHFWTLSRILSIELQVKVELSHHQIQEGEWKATKPLVFVLDEPSTEPKPKKAKTKKGGGPQMTSKNFGSWMSITKLKTCADTLSIVWRCRLALSVTQKLLLFYVVFFPK